MIHSHVMDNVGHELKLLAALLTVREGSIGKRCRPEIWMKKKNVRMFVTFCAELLENGGNRLLMAELTEPIWEG